MNGMPGEPQRVGTIIGDLAASLYAALGTVAALREAESKGVGRLVDISQQDAVFTLTENAVVNFTTERKIAQPLGNDHPFVRPYGRYECKDGHVFFRQGDMGRFDRDGFLELLDRKKDMIISGGFNIYANDLELELLKHPAVTDVAVIGVPSEEWGESPYALIVKRADALETAAQIVAWANQRLGKLQRLAGGEFRDELPRSSIGKILKRALRAPFWEKAGRKI